MEEFSILPQGGLSEGGKKPKPFPLLDGFPKKYINRGWKHSLKRHIQTQNDTMLFEWINANKSALNRGQYFVKGPGSRSFRCVSPSGGIEFQFCIRGRAKFQIKKLNKDDGYWRHVMAGKHNFQVYNGFINDAIIDTNEPLEILNIAISLELLKEFARKYPAMQRMVEDVMVNANTLLLAYPRVTTNEMHLIIVEIYTLVNEDELDLELLDNLIDKLIFLFLEYRKEPGMPFAFDTVEKFFNARTYLLENYKHSNCSVTDARLEAGIDPNRFCSGFKRLFAVAPKQYLKVRRMEKAKEFFLRGDALSVREVMQEVGMVKLDYFLKQYKEYHKVSAQEHFDQGRLCDIDNQ